MCKFLIIITTSFLPLMLMGQNTILLEKRVTVSMENRKLGEVMDELERQAGFSFSYNAALIDAARVVSVKATNRPLREVCKKLFGNAIELKEKKGFIILTKMKEQEKKVVVGGYVETPDGMPLQNATVYDERTLTSANTNEFGYYEMKVKHDLPAMLRVSKELYNDTTSPLQPHAGELQNIIMKPTPRDTTWRGIISQWVDSTAVLFDRLGQQLNPDSLLQHWNDSTRNAFNDSLHDLRMNALRTNTAKQWRSLRQWMLADSIRNHNVGDTIYRKFQFSLLPYVGTNRKMSPYCINDYSFSLLGGYCRAVRKVELGAFLNIVREEVDGIQLAGFANLVGGSVSGLQAAGFTNVVRGDVNGLQLAGFTNVNAGNATGAAFSGFVNVTKGNAVGVHGAGFINVVRGSTKGVLAAGFGNFSKGNMYGVQMAGFINTAMHVRGVQLGIINVCDSMQGVPIGLFNFVKKGYHTLEFSSNDIYRVNAAWRSGMRALYTITQAGVKLGKSNYKDVYSLGYGLGTSPRIMSWLYANIEATCNYSILDVYHIIDDEFYVSKLVKPFHYIHLDNQLYLGLDFRISKKFAVSSGALVHCLISENQYIYTNYFDSTLPQFFYHEDSGNTNMRMWLGWKVAIRFF